MDCDGETDDELQSLLDEGEESDEEDDELPALANESLILPEGEGRTRV